jgi:hypothetical protein
MLLFLSRHLAWELAKAHGTFRELQREWAFNGDEMVGMHHRTTFHSLLHLAEAPQATALRLSGCYVDGGNKYLPTLR